VSTYRLSLVNEQTGEIHFSHEHIPESSVRAVEGFIREHLDLVIAAAGTVQATRGVREALAGIERVIAASAARPRPRTGPRR
jgi:hypothetical protein